MEYFSFLFNFFTGYFIYSLYEQKTINMSKLKSIKKNKEKLNLTDERRRRYKWLEIANTSKTLGEAVKRVEESKLGEEIVGKCKYFESVFGSEISMEDFTETYCDYLEQTNKYKFSAVIEFSENDKEKLKEILKYSKTNNEAVEKLQSSNIDKKLIERFKRNIFTASLASFWKFGENLEKENPNNENLKERRKTIKRDIDLLLQYGYTLEGSIELTKWADMDEKLIKGVKEFYYYYMNTTDEDIRQMRIEWSENLRDYFSCI